MKSNLDMLVPEFKVIVLGTRGAHTKTLIVGFGMSKDVKCRLIGDHTHCGFSVRDNSVKLDIVDNQEKYEGDDKPTDAFIILGHAESEQSYFEMKRLILQVKKSHPGTLIGFVYDLSTANIPNMQLLELQKQKAKELAAEQGLQCIFVNTKTSRDTDAPFRIIAETMIARVDAQQAIVGPAQFLAEASSRVEVMSEKEAQRALTLLCTQADFGKNLKSDFCEKLYNFLFKKLGDKKREFSISSLRVFIGSAILLEHEGKFTSRMATAFAKIIPELIIRIGNKPVAERIETLFDPHGSANLFLTEIEALFRLLCPALYFPSESKIEVFLVDYVAKNCGRKHFFQYWTQWPLRGRTAVHVLAWCNAKREDIGKSPGHNIDLRTKSNASVYR